MERAGLDRGGGETGQGVGRRPRSTPQGLPLRCETTEGVASRQESVVSTGTLCPEFTVTGRVTQSSASKDGEAESGLELPPSSQDQSGNQENRAEC